MKFRVETWDTTERCAPYIIEAEGEAFSPWSHWDRVRSLCPYTTKVRLWIKHNWSWLMIGENYGTKETAPLPLTHEWWKARADAYTAKRDKEAKPMSTKQRGDVEKINAHAEFLVHINPSDPSKVLGAIAFTRDEFRRIWEAGNAEFKEVAASWTGERLWQKDIDEIARLRVVLAEKEAEIARLQECNNNQATIIAQKLDEVARLRGWLQYCHRNEVRGWANRALAGEKVPE